MRAVIQRALRATVSVEAVVVGSIGEGLLVLLGVTAGDTEQDVAWMVDKIVNLRVFSDSAGKMNLSVRDRGGALLVVSQFTLCGDCTRGRRPSFDAAAPAGQARSLYESFLSRVRGAGLPVEAGVFQAHMAVELLNDGPVTLVVDSP
jgi:D-tyrosyl-tRNA(Tyr) deacylase